jgi:hypothetical protein
MSKFWGCCHCECDPTLNAGGSGYSYGNVNPVNLNADCSGDMCVQLTATLTFASNRIAGAVVGTGNYTPSTLTTPATAGPWLLFNRGGEPIYDRDGSREIPFSVTLQEHPTNPDLMILAKIELKNEFVWERKSWDPDSADFLVFEQIGDKIDAPPFAAAGDYCLNIALGAVRYSYVIDQRDYPDGVPLEVEVTLENDPCSFQSPLCLEWLGGEQVIDEWIMGGEWIGSYTDGECSGGAYIRVGRGSLFNGTFTDCTEILGSFHAWNGDCNLYGVWEECSHDPRECPLASDFIIDNGDLPFTCDGSLDSITCGDCGPTNDCPPEECPTSWCKWQWDPDTLSWDLIETNCLEGSECGDPPADPEDTTLPHVSCTCCVTPGPECDVGWSPCLGDTCSFVWSSLGNVWNPSACLTEGCFCHFPPEEPGEFNGQTVAGICCSEDAP